MNLSAPKLEVSMGLALLRIILGILMISHGVARLYYGSVADFGAFLQIQGLVFGLILAWVITIVDILGGIFLAIGFGTRIVSSWFIIVLFTGVLLVHAPQGWFVVGHGSGGMEYSVLLIACMIVVGWTK